jgi:uncharacterized protein (DUF433 family)
MSQLISARVPDATADRLRRYARRKQRSVNETLSTALEEWMRQNEHSYIEFRDTASGRQAYMRGSRIPVWWLIKLAREYDMNLDKTAAYWSHFRSKAWVQAALNYYRDYPGEIDQLISDDNQITSDELTRLLPNLELLTVTIEPDQQNCE